MKTKKEPIVVFKDEKEAVECMEEWKKILFLDDWFIKITLDDCGNLDQEFKLGDNTFNANSKASHITINHKNYQDEFITKCPNELTLVHELLHCKQYWLDRGEELNMLEEQRIEEMAKSLIMLKYGLTREWFKNF